MSKYWVCIIEVNKKKLPNGFDLPPRMAAIKAVESKNIKVKNCWSGWGCKEETFNEIMRVWNKKELQQKLQAAEARIKELGGEG